MPYLIIAPLGPINAAQRAEAISRELYCLTLPREKQDETQHVCTVFPVFNFGGISGLEVWPETEIHLDPEADLEAYLSLYAGDQMEQVRELMATAEIVSFGQIFPEAELLSWEQLQELIPHAG